VVLLMLYSEKMICYIAHNFKYISTEIHIKEIAELATKVFLLIMFKTKGGFFLKFNYLFYFNNLTIFWFRDFVEFFQTFNNFFQFSIFSCCHKCKNSAHKTRKKNTVHDTDFAWGLGIK
jgi:hypothetical protein